MVKLALNETDMATIRNFLTGGALVGGSAGLVMELVRQLRSDARPITDDMVEERRQINLPVKATKTATVGQPEAPSVVTPGLGLFAGVAGAGGAYALVRHLVVEAQKRRAQKELEDEQKLFNDTLDQEAAILQQKKTAAEAGGRSLSTTETIAGIPVALLATIMLASGAGTHALLSDRAGGIGPDKLTKPTNGPKLVMKKDIDNDGEPDIQEELGYNVKQATYNVISRGIALDLCQTHPESDTARLVRSIRDLNTYNKFAAMVVSDGWESAVSSFIDGAKIASEPRVGVVDIVMSTLLASGPATKIAFSILAAAEQNDYRPDDTAAAAFLPDDLRETLVKIAADMSMQQVLAELGITPPVAPGAEGRHDEVPEQLINRITGNDNTEEGTADQLDLATGAPSAEDVRRNVIL